jgi:predicted glutamine amidotransferase
MVVGAGKIDVGELVDGLLNMAARGEHFAGWGMAWLENGNFKLYKSPDSCLEDSQADALRKIESPLVVLHARKSPTRSLGETHPWVRAVDGVQYAFCYNGSFAFEGPDSYRPLGFVDDVFSQLRPGGERDALSSVLSSLKRIHGANLVLANPDVSTIMVRYSRKPHHYRMALSAGKGHVVISSEPIRGSWVALPNGTVVRAGTDGAYELSHW